MEGAGQCKAVGPSLGTRICRDRAEKRRGSRSDLNHDLSPKIAAILELWDALVGKQRQHVLVEMPRVGRRLVGERKNNYREVLA
jgi:hypothetical protein